MIDHAWRYEDSISVWLQKGMKLSRLYYAVRYRRRPVTGEVERPLRATVELISQASYGGQEGNVVPFRQRTRLAQAKPGGDRTAIDGGKYMLKHGKQIRLTEDEKKRIAVLTSERPAVTTVDGLNNFLDFHQKQFSASTPEEVLIRRLLEAEKL